MKGSTVKTIYSIVLFILLAAFEHIVIGLFPPLFPYIAEDLKINIGSLGFISASNILATAISSIYWGYFSGKYNRKKLMMIGTFLWIVSIFFTSVSENFLQLWLFQLLTGIGLGCMAAIGFSVLTDYIPYGKRGFILSFWGMAQGLGGIVGSILAALTVTDYGWRWSFDIVGLVGLSLLFLYLFTDEPQRGATEPEMQHITKNYRYQMKWKDLKPLLLKKSNQYLFFQALFMNIATGSLIWIPTLFLYKLMKQGNTMEIAVIAAGYLYALFQIGGMSSFYFGHLGDRYKNRRSYITALLVFITCPLYIFLFIMPMTGLKLINDANPFIIFLHIIELTITTPSMTLLFILAILASASQSANTPNWLALMTDVNLPEHRGIVFSIANVFNSIGRTIGNVGVGILVGWFSITWDITASFLLALCILQLFLIPSALYYVKMAQYNVKDINDARQILQKRAYQADFQSTKKDFD